MVLQIAFSIALLGLCVVACDDATNNNGGDDAMSRADGVTTDTLADGAADGTADATTMDTTSEGIGPEDANGVFEIVSQERTPEGCGAFGDDEESFGRTHILVRYERVNFGPTTIPMMQVGTCTGAAECAEFYPSQSVRAGGQEEWLLEKPVGSGPWRQMIMGSAGKDDELGCDATRTMVAISFDGERLVVEETEETAKYAASTCSFETLDKDVPLENWVCIKERKIVAENQAPIP